MAIAVVASSISLGLGGIAYVSMIEGIMCAMAAGMGKEFGDYMHYGKWDWGDMAAEMVGAIVGVALCLGVFLLFGLYVNYN